MENIYKRRAFIKSGIQSVSGILGVGLLFAACNNNTDSNKENKNVPPPDTTGKTDAKTVADPCDAAALTEQDLKNRKALGYVAQTPIPEKTCESCKLFVPPNDTKKCGTCSLFKGPIDVGGYCTYWADKSV